MITFLKKITASHQYVLILLAVLLLPACSAVPPQEPADADPATYPVNEVVRDDVYYAIDVYDPWEGMNRNTYIFNAYADEYVLLPVLGVYENYVPSILRQGVHNFFSNLSSFGHTINSGLQLKGESTLNNGLRFVSNSTIGILGFIDVATGMGFPEMKEDFGQTLGYWGVSDGPYIVLPLLGPSNLRDTTGIAVDFVINDYFVNDLLGMNGDDGWSYFYYIMYGIDARAKVPFRYYQSGSPFEYETVRLLYTSGRKVLIGE